MPSITTSLGYPPQTQQLASGSGVLTNVAVPVPRTYNPISAVAGRTPYPMDCDLFDGDPLNGGTMLTSSVGGDQSGAISLPFSNGLYIRQRNSNSVTVTFTGTAYAPTALPNTQA
jgi:hypothetical protein